MLDKEIETKRGVWKDWVRLDYVQRGLVVISVFLVFLHLFIAICIYFVAPSQLNSLGCWIIFGLYSFGLLFAAWHTDKAVTLSIIRELSDKSKKEWDEAYFDLDIKRLEAIEKKQLEIYRRLYEL